MTLKELSTSGATKDRNFGLSTIYQRGKRDKRAPYDGRPKQQGGLSQI